MSLILWGRRSSSNVQKALWALDEAGVDFERRVVGGGFGGGDDPAYRAMNPNGLVPTLQDGDLVLFESDAILRHLSRRYGAGTLAPEEPGAFALADQWTTWNTTTFYPAVAALFFPTIRTPRAEQRPETLGPQIERMAQATRMLDARLEGRDFIAGDAFSFGEIGLAISARRAFLLPVGAPEGPNVRRWLDRLAERPAFGRWIDVPIGTCLEEWREIEKALA